jgi:hypothetical protein
MPDALSSCFLPYETSLKRSRILSDTPLRERSRGVRNNVYVSDMKSKLAHRILVQAAEFPEGHPLTAKGLLHLGNRAATDQALSRLSRVGKLMRLGRGVYVVPIEGRFGRRAPAPENVVAEWAKLRGETIAPHGAVAANRLGLTTQVPMRTTYLTSGQSRKLTLGAQLIELKHVPHWQLTNAARVSGELVRVLAWAGRSRANETLGLLAPGLTSKVREELLAARVSLPEWLAEAISLELTTGRRTSPQSLHKARGEPAMGPKVRRSAARAQKRRLSPGRT